MKIQSKYFTICPACNKNIIVGAEVEWSQGQKAIHIECVKATTEQMIHKFKKTHKSGDITFLNEDKGIYSFEWTKKNGSKKLVQYYSNGDRYHEGSTKGLLGVRS